MAGVPFAEWVDDAVQITRGPNNHTSHGTLQEITDYGLVLEHEIYFPDPNSEVVYDDYGGSTGNQVSRVAAELIPWCLITGVRALEPEEKTAYGYS